MKNRFNQDPLPDVQPQKTTSPATIGEKHIIRQIEAQESTSRAHTVAAYFVRSTVDLARYQRSIENTDDDEKKNHYQRLITVTENSMKARVDYYTEKDGYAAVMEVRDILSSINWALTEVKVPTITANIAYSGTEKPLELTLRSQPQINRYKNVA